MVNDLGEGGGELGGFVCADAVDFTVFEHYFNRVKARDIVNPHIRPEPQADSPAVVPMVLARLPAHNLTKQNCLAKESEAEFETKIDTIDRYRECCERRVKKQN